MPRSEELQLAIINMVTNDKRAKSFDTIDFPQLGTSADAVSLQVYADQDATPGGGGNAATRIGGHGSRQKGGEKWPFG